MPHSFGLRARTRHLFAVPHGEHGPVHLSTYLVQYKLGDFVDIAGNGKIHKGLPHKGYHGKTGRVWNVTPHAIGVEINKQVGHRFLKKRIHVRIEHVKRSTCRDDFIKRVKANDAKRREAAKNKTKVNLKRKPQGPRESFVLNLAGLTVEDVKPIPYADAY